MINRKVTMIMAQYAFLSSALFADQEQNSDVRILYSQAVSTMNPYLSTGAKDVTAASLVLEPLAGYDNNGKLYPRLAAKLPSVENGMISEDYTSITWQLKPDLKWSDGTNVTASDIIFTAQYCMDTKSGCVRSARFDGISSIEKTGDLAVKINFENPKYNPFEAFVSATSPIIQKAQFAKCLGAAALTCSDENFMPVGTGPFHVTNFKVNDVVSFNANPLYRDASKPAFAKATIKGGNDAAAVARAVMETGEFDYGWNTQIPPNLQEQMSKGGKGKFVSGFGALVERIEMNMTDASPELPEGERSVSKNAHPILSDVRVRKALSMAIDRNLLVDIGYGEAGRPTCDLIPAPKIYSGNNAECLTQNIEGAKALLEKAGWKIGADGVREKGGRRLEIFYHTSVNPVRQDFQALIKSWWQEIGVDVTLKSTQGSIFFGGGMDSPDTVYKFYADAQMYANAFSGTDPESYFAGLTCEKAPKPENQWNSTNISRYCDPEYDALVHKLASTNDTNNRVEIIKKLNNMLTTESHTIIPLVARGNLSARANDLGGVVMNVWDSELWNIQDWHRIQNTEAVKTGN